MGPGLFLALALLFPGAAAAETAVGLDARGVDPMAAVNNRWGLDVRDELGRPVSGEKILTELKSASAARAAANAFASSLPQARAVLSALELLARAKANLWEFLPSLPQALAAMGLPSPRPKISAVLLIAAVLLTVSCTAFRPRPSAAAVLSRSCCCPEVLRC